MFGKFGILLMVKPVATSSFISPKGKIYRAGVGEGEKECTSVFEHYDAVTDARARELWEAEYTDRVHACMHGANCKTKGCTTGMRMLDHHILAGAVVPLWSAIEGTVNKFNTGRKARFRIIRAVETTADDPPVAGGGVASSSSSSSSAPSSSSSSSSSPTSAGPKVTAAAKGKQCIGIRIENWRIDRVLEGLQRGIDA